MKYRKKIIAGAMSVTTLLAGCSGGDIESTPSNSSTIIQGLNRVNDRTFGNVLFGFAEGTNRDLAALQFAIGSAANKLLIKISPIPVVVDGKKYNATFSIPPEDVIRTYQIVANSSLKGGSRTTQSLVKNAAGQSNLTQADGIIGQESSGPGPIINATTELCQGLDLFITTPDGQAPSQDEYTKIKEGGCNGIGVATDRHSYGIAYEEYRKDFTGRLLGGSAAHGSAIEYPVIPRAGYDMLPVSK